MPGTRWDWFVRSLAQRQRVGDPRLDLSGLIQPVANVSHTANFVSPPVAEVPFNFGFADSAFTTPGQPALGTTGTVMLNRAGIVAGDVQKAPPVWYWVQRLPAVSQDASNPFVSLVHRSRNSTDLAIYTPDTQNASVSMAPSARRRDVHHATTNTNAGGFVAQGEAGLSMGVNEIYGPFFADADMIPMVIPQNDRFNVRVNFWWIEEPSQIPGSF